MATRKKKDPYIMYVRRNATLREIYAQLKSEFTAADLQKYTEIEKGIPAEKVLAELEGIHRRELRRRKKK